MAVRLLVCLLLVSFPACAQTVVSGDTLKLKGTVYQLWGIAAPALNQTCANGWQAGKASADYLAGLIRGHAIECQPKGPGPAGRTRAICKADNRDLGAEMVSAGMAWASLRDGQDYVVQEANAMGAFLGVHGHECMKVMESRTVDSSP